MLVSLLQPTTGRLAANEPFLRPNKGPVSLCSYKDYRSNEDYSLTPQFWLISAVRFAFVILFEVSQEARQLNRDHPEPPKTATALA